MLGFGGRVPQAGDAVAIAGGDPVFQTPFRIATAACAVLGALGLALSDVWKLRTGRTQSVSLNARTVAASLRSNVYVRRNGEKIISWDPLSGHYRTRDGRYYWLHTNHPHHRAGALRVAGVPSEDKELLAAAIAQRNGLEFEAAIDAAGCVGGLTRSPEEWAAHPHAKVVQTLPLFDLVKIADAPARPLPAAPRPPAPAARPLGGVRVLDLTRVLAGPSGGRTLAEHGADVLHITADHLPYQTELLMDTGHGKRCATLDLRDAGDVAKLKALASEADVFLQSYRPGTLAARGFSPEALAAMRPGIVCVDVCAYGHAGPWAGRRGFDSIVQNVTGIAATQGTMQAPRNLPGQALDYTTGYLAALGATLALARRAKQGGSWMVRVSLVQVAHWVSSLGMVDRSAGAVDLPKEELAGLYIESDGPFGRLRHLKPALQLSETPAFHARPAEPLGSSPAAWC